MSRSLRYRATAFAAALLPMLAVACGPDSASNPASPAISSGGPSLSAADLGAGDGLANFEHIEVCKYGSTADVTVDMTQVSTGNTSVTYSFADGECRVLGNFDATVGLGPADITASESNIQAGFQFDSVRTTIVGRNGAPSSVNVSTTNSFNILGANNDIGILLEFYNSETFVPGDEGCTPGYWKQTHHFDSWTGFSPNQTLESVFDVPNSLGYDNVTLLGALNFGGGSGVAGGARILLRAAVAALLNSSSPDVDYTLTTAQVIAAVNAALASGDRDIMLDLAADLDADNNLGCPLN